MKNEKFNRFSVPLGLLDYINPIFYSITIITIMNNINMKNPYYTIMIVGVVLSILFGFVIPTGKVIVGLGIIKFKMPVSLVFLVNTGLLFSGLMIFKYVFSLKLFLLFYLYFHFLVLIKELLH